MKKLLLFTIALLTLTQAYGQEYKLRKKYINLNFSEQTLKPQDGGLSLKSNFGAAFTVGRTFMLHKEPIAGMIRFGIDATWFDLNYTNYKIEFRGFENEYNETESEITNFHQAEFAMQVGPSVTVNPIDQLHVHAYFRYAPGYSLLYDNEVIWGSYASYFVGGAAVSYGIIGLGIESRFGSCKYKDLAGDDEEEDLGEGYPDNSSIDSLKAKFSGMRVYLTFRF